MTKIDIITTTYRNTDKLRLCLSSVVENTKYVDYKWYVWVNDPNEALSILEDLSEIEKQKENRFVPVGLEIIIKNTIPNSKEYLKAMSLLNK